MQDNGKTTDYNGQTQSDPTSGTASDPTASTSSSTPGCSQTRQTHGPTDHPRATRRPASQRSASFDLTAWLVEGATGLLEELRHSDLGLSEEFWVHFYAARRESLLAARVLVDILLAKLEQEEGKNEEMEQRRARRGDVKIDF